MKETLTMMKLYYSARTRAVRARIALEEAGAEYEIVRLDMKKKEHKAPGYLRIHPHGAVPALVDDGVAIFESAAICAYVADKFPEKQLAPALGTPARGVYYQWLVYSLATLEPPVLKTFLNTIVLPEAERSASVAEEGRRQFAVCARVIDEALGGREFLLGDRLTAADIMIGGILGWASSMKLLGTEPRLEVYASRLAARPAWKRANAD